MYAGIPKESSLWYVPHLEEGVQLIRKLDPNQEDSVKMCPGIIAMECYNDS